MKLAVGNQLLGVVDGGVLQGVDGGRGGPGVHRQLGNSQLESCGGGFGGTCTASTCPHSNRKCRKCKDDVDTCNSITGLIV